MAEKKSILEEALLDISNIQNALNANTKEILRSVAKEEIDSVVKESIEEEIYEEEIYEEETLDEYGDEHAITTKDALEKGKEKKEETLDEYGDEHAITTKDALEKGKEKKEKSEKVTEGYDEEGLEIEDEIGMGVETPNEFDMTKGGTDEEIFDIYKKLTSTDEIEIVDDELRINISEPGEYVIKLDSLKDVDSDEEYDSEELDNDELEFGSDEESEEESEEDNVYNIELDDEDESEEDESEEDESEEDESEEDESEEDEDLDENLAQTRGSEKNAGRYTAASKHPLEEVKKAREIVSETAKKYNSLLTEAKKIKAENQEFRTALKEFRTKLVETVVFNSNLTYVTKLFTEHSTTKAEKQNIIKRFDQVSNLVESKKLYKVISNELDNRKPINETFESKIIKESTTSVSKQLNENTAYIDPSTQRIKDLINRVEKR